MWQHARKKMKDYENSQAFGELRHETIVQHGDPWDVVSRVIRQNRIDLLILGTHGRTGIRKLVLGSQAEIIFRQAPCPVITVGPHLETVNADTWGPKTIIFATDFSDISAHALPFALSLAEENHSRLVLLHLAPLAPPDSDSDTEGSSIEKLSQLVPVQAKDRVQAEYVTRVDIPAEGILKIAEERNADLIVMGVRKRSIPSASAHLPWATASAVVSRACCPVLTVRG
jgi:nucleotide-binding universal stress UspA family protein